MLKLIGLGLDDNELTLKGKNALESAEKVYAEFFTNTETVSLDELEKKVNQEIEKVSREEVEKKDVVFEAAKEYDVAFLISGDPITATTHYDIKHRAAKKDIKTEIIHAPSILTSIGETGLNSYKFGRVVTLPEDSTPNSVIAQIKKNDSINLHTLVLLDINYEAEIAAEKLVEMSPELKDREAIFYERANSNTRSIKVGRLSELNSKGPVPHSIILVGEKSHKETEYLEKHY